MTIDSPLKILIIEDDLSFALELEMMIKEIGYQVIGRVDHSALALEFIYTESPDLILMDIDIKGKLSGLEIGAKIQHLKIPILFITSFGDDAHYKEAQKSYMLGYMVKPIEKYSLRTAITLAIQSLMFQESTEEKVNNFYLKDFFFFKKKNIYHKIPVKEVLFFEADDKYCTAKMKNNNEFILRQTMNHLEEFLQKDLFFRIHRKYIVNLSLVDSVDVQNGKVSIQNMVLPISRINRKIFFTRVKNLG